MFKSRYINPSPNLHSHFINNLYVLQWFLDSFRKGNLLIVCTYYILYTLSRAISSWFDLACERCLFSLVPTPFHFWILPKGDRHGISEGKEEQGICIHCVAAMARQFSSLPPLSLSPQCQRIFTEAPLFQVLGMQRCMRLKVPATVTHLDSSGKDRQQTCCRK